MEGKGFDQIGMVFWGTRLFLAIPMEIHAIYYELNDKKTNWSTLWLAFSNPRTGGVGKVFESLFYTELGFCMHSCLGSYRCGGGGSSSSEKFPMKGGYTFGKLTSELTKQAYQEFQYWNEKKS